MTRTTSWLLLTVAISLSAIAASSCSGDGGAAASGAASGDPGASASGTGGGQGQPELCGEDPCADHEGEKDFYAEGAPADSGDLFENGDEQPAGTDPAHEPAIVYPNHETMFPINISRIRHEWVSGGNTLYHLLFVGPKTTVHVYTVTTDWQPGPEEWDWIAESNRGEEVVFTVFGLDQAAPETIWQSAPITLSFSKANVEGAIYYWSTSSAGIMKGLVSSPDTVKFFPDPADKNDKECAACHTLSRDGKRMAVAHPSEQDSWEITVPGRQRILPADPKKPRGAAWATFSPDGEMLLVAYGGELTLLDSDTGLPIGPNGGIVALPEGVRATHPDWSALGDYVAVTLHEGGAGHRSTSQGSIARLPYNGGAWGPPEVLVAEAGDGWDNNVFPSHSPDSQWIAYVNYHGPSQENASGTLRMIPAGGGTPIDLVRLNGRVNNVDGVEKIGNTMPTWAPSSLPGTFWLAFSSLREYATLRPRDAHRDQIWIAAIDPTRPEPSFSAFWAPFQEIDEANHRAFWTHSSEDECACAEFCADTLDNDCDGTADEADCLTCEVAEICDDGIDNDCNCAIDDCLVPN